jgi:hypothetical protein
VKIRGRGSAGYTIALPVEQRWSVTKFASGSYYSYVPVSTARDPTPYGYYSDPFVYSPGTLLITSASASRMPVTTHKVIGGMTQDRT